MGTEVKDVLGYRYGRACRKWSAALHRQSPEAFDLRALQVLAQLPGPYVAWGGWAMRPSGVVRILNEIATTRCEAVVELGSGVSTVYTGRLLAERGLGHLFSVEHDAAWAAQTRRRLEDEHLTPYVTLVEAPLADGEWDSGPWYDAAVLERALADVRIDLLVVDGPPAVGGVTRHARYPAPVHFREALAPDCGIVLDDIDRRGEQEIVRRWEHELGRVFVRKFLDGGVAVSRLAPPGATPAPEPAPAARRSRPAGSTAPSRGNPTGSARGR